MVHVFPGIDGWIDGCDHIATPHVGNDDLGDVACDFGIGRIAGDEFRKRYRQWSRIIFRRAPTDNANSAAASARRRATRMVTLLEFLGTPLIGRAWIRVDTGIS